MHSWSSSHCSVSVPSAIGLVVVAPSPSVRIKTTLLLPSWGARRSQDSLLGLSLVGHSISLLGKADSKNIVEVDLHLSGQKMNERGGQAHL